MKQIYLNSKESIIYLLNYLNIDSSYYVIGEFKEGVISILEYGNGYLILDNSRDEEKTFTVSSIIGVVDIVLEIIFKIRNKKLIKTML